jgi:quercetin dioxygenase-like cupin family protein
MSDAIMEARRAGFVSGSGEGRTVHVLGLDVRIKIASSDTQDAFTVFDAEIPPMAGPPMHRHAHQDEVWQVMEGEFRFVVDGQEVHGRAGDTVFAPRGSEHTFQNVGSSPGHLLTTVVPGGLDVFFEDLEAVSPRGTVPDPGKLMPIFEQHGMELLGPPLPRPVERVPCD